MCTRRSTAPCLSGIDWQETITAFIVSGSVTDCLIGSQESVIKSPDSVLLILCKFKVELYSNVVCLLSWELKWRQRIIKVLLKETLQQ